ncbi:MAG TPA: serine/threonine-protein kinase, partial [Kofleriaceae bacterium]|nr:serine/threonine-protein kinase [Kofleriaceae bacterium]
MVSAAGPSLSENEHVAGYVIEARIGVGGFGEVYRARHPLIGREVAIKVLHAKYSADPEAVSRFVAEARAVNQISHPNIVEIFDFGKLSDGREFCVMELLEGATLRDLLRARTRLPLAEALPILVGIAEAVDAAHDAGIAHRDLKPDNVFILAGGGVKLIDFGLAKLTRELDAPVTQTGSVFGTPLYMSPEQCRGKASDTRTDLYSFGVLVYQVLTGELPFSGDALELALHHLNDQPSPPSKRHKEITRNVDQVVLALLAKDPADRPPSLVNATAALSGSTTLRARRWTHRARRLALVATIAAAGGAAIVWNRHTAAVADDCVSGTSRLA